jgi:hypothetical protein
MHFHALRTLWKFPNVALGFFCENKYQNSRFTPAKAVSLEHPKNVLRA